jgi:hypothetical protein
MRREAINPARHGPEFSTATTLSIRSLPRRAKPSRFTCSYSEAFVRRRLFGKEKEPVGAMSFSMLLPVGSATFRSGVSVQQKSSPGCDRRKTSQEKGLPQTLLTGRWLGRRSSCCVGRFSGCRRTAYSGRCRRRSSRRRGCRRFGCLGLLLARREKCGTGQNADVFLHSASSKRDIAVIK